MYFTDFYNEHYTSHAKSMFQVIAGNDGRVLHWNGMSLTIDYSRLSSDRPDWYSAKVALLMSKGGADWSEWDCG